MEQKTITFYEESYWTDNGCSCCPAWEWTIFNTDPDVHPIAESCDSREDCYISALHYFGYPIVEMSQEDCWEYTLDELESICREYNIEVVFSD